MSNETILKVIVGSQMWGTATPESDTDYKEVVMAPLADVLNPFKNHGKGIQRENEGDDNALYELMHFFRLCEKGNPTLLEVLYTPLIVEQTEIGEELRRHRHEWIDSKNVIKATTGMAKAQLMRAKRYLAENPHDRRIGKLYASTALSLELSRDVIASQGKMEDIKPSGMREAMIRAKQGDIDVYPALLDHIESTTLSIQFMEAHMTHFEARKGLMTAFCRYWYQRGNE